MKLLLRCLGAFCLLSFQPLLAQTYTLTSPDFKLKINIQNLGDCKFDLQYNDKKLASATVAMLIANKQTNDLKVWGRDAKIKNANTNYVNDLIEPFLKVKNAIIKNEYNELTLEYRQDYNLVFRLYNDAFAYRWVSLKKDTLLIKHEISNWEINPQSLAYFQKVEKQNYGGANLAPDGIITLNNYERPYLAQTFTQLNTPSKVQLPLLMKEPDSSIRLLLTESDLFDYPGLYFQATQKGQLNSVFPPVVKNTKMVERPNFGWDRLVVPTEHQDYIARTGGTRLFPWRIMAIAHNDKDLLNNEIVSKLATPSKIADASWIKTGKVAWDWWNDWGLTHINFKAGINTATYKAYIDFAAQHGLTYIVMDDGWYELGNLTKPIDAINISELVAYGNQKGIGILLWGSWKTLNDQMTSIMDMWQQWGVKGMKIDFMERDDQEVVGFYERCAAEAAKRQLIIDFHGAYKPTGLHITYPNVLNYEGVLGLEQNKWAGQLANPEMAVTIPFARMVAGPLDYTPGAMLNAQRHEYAAINSKPMSLGTRCQQLAMYVVYEAPLQMLSDSPSNYQKEPECMEFLSKVPTTWDTTIPLLGQIGDYIAIARKKGEEWYVGAMTDWSARNLTLDLSFLPKGNYKMDTWQDGINADRNGTDYKRVHYSVKSGDKLSINLAQGGGFAARIYK
jgi:alpha-glucosidase